MTDFDGQRSVDEFASASDHGDASPDAARLGEDLADPSALEADDRGRDDHGDPDADPDGDASDEEAAAVATTDAESKSESESESESADEEDSVETTTVRERVREALDAETLHGLVVTKRTDETVYLVASRSTTLADIDSEDMDLDIPVLDVRTVVVDLGDDAVSVGDNGMWVPRDADVSESLTKLLGRTTTDVSRGDASEEPLARSAVGDVDVDLLLEREIAREDAVTGGQHTDKMERHVGIDPAREWGYGAGPPPEVSETVARLEEAGLDPSEHLSRLVWGKKEPMDRVTRPVDELTGNYGIELQPRDSGLIAIDVDYPDEFPDAELPETWEVSSPHGDDRRRHIILRCEDKTAIYDELGAWAVQSVPWGDLWIGDRYVVGPGSQLSEYGCDDPPHDRGEKGGCEACEDPADGNYRVVSDRPIATVEPEVIIDLLEEFLSDEESDHELRDGPADADPPEGFESESPPECDACGATEDAEGVELTELSAGDSTRYICRGGCDA